MKLSFYDEKSMEEAIGSLRFGFRDDISNSETGDSIDIIVDQERLDRIGIQIDQPLYNARTLLRLFQFEPLFFPPPLYVVTQ
jgi:hypothetical protein